MKWAEGCPGSLVSVPLSQSSEIPVPSREESSGALHLGRGNQHQRASSSFGETEVYLHYHWELEGLWPAEHQPARIPVVLPIPRLACLPEDEIPPIWGTLATPNSPLTPAC